MYLQEILERLTHATPRHHQPKFRLEHGPREGWRVFDGEIAIAVFSDRGYFYFDIFRFSPFEAPILHNPEPRAVFDIHTLRNTTVNLPYTSGRDLVAGCTDPFGAMTWEWLQREGDALRLRLSGDFADGQRMVYHIGITYDPAWHRYRFTFDADAWKRERTGMEPLNMMMPGALQARGERRRWSHSVWEDPFGQLRRMVLSNALFMATDYAPAQWRTRNAPVSGAWIAYGTHERFNPAMLIHHSSPVLRFAICSQLFDEHIIWTDAGFDDLDGNCFHFALKTELVNLPPDLVAGFLDKAIDPPRPERWESPRIALPLYMDIVNDLEQPADPWLPEDCPILCIDPVEQPGIAWVSDVAYSGSHSLRLTGTNRHGRQTLHTNGAVCNVEPDSRYRFTAKVKTANVERFARLELFTYEYTYNNVIDLAQSPQLGGDHDWTELSVELDTGDEAYIMPQLMLYGAGTAWFDDLQLVKIG